MSTSSFQMSNFQPVEGRIIVQTAVPVQFSFSSAYSTGIHVDLSSEEDLGARYQQSQDTSTDGTNDSGLTFSDTPDNVDLAYRITVTGEADSQNTVYVRIES